MVCRQPRAVGWLCLFVSLWRTFGRSVGCSLYVRSSKMGCCCSKEDDAKNPKEGMKKEKAAASKKKELAEYIAQWDYKTESGSELNLTKGDRLKEVHDEADVGPEWVFASKPDTGIGYAPRAHLALVGSFDTEEWYYGEITRGGAEKVLRHMENGTFILRGRQTKEGTAYALTIADDGSPKHYRIKKVHPSDDQVQYRLGKKNFDAVFDLMDYFSKNSDGICRKLTKPAPKRPPERIQLPVDVQKCWREIPRDQIELGKVLGSGNFGIVKKGIWRPKATIVLEVAVKELKKGSTSGKKDFLAEAVAMKALMHKNLVRLHGIVSANEPYWIVTEFVKDGSLKEFLKRVKDEQRTISEHKLVDISTQIAEGMRYLESKSVIHRDLAARNVLVDVRAAEKQNETNISVKIADFGLATMMKGKKVKEKGDLQLSVKWAAPEAWRQLHFSTASDVWSFGIVLFEVFTYGEDPYENQTIQQVKSEQTEKKGLTLRLAGKVPDKVEILIETCCIYEARARISFRDAVDFLEKFYDVIEEDMYAYEAMRR